jgi:glycosyltransferase involved in cell wall biosynthesis
MSLLKRLYWTVAIPLSARTADAVITISQNSKDDIIGLLRIPEQKVFVTLLGPGQELQQKTPWEVVKAKYGLPEDFFLSVGTAAHKRLDLSLTALRTLQRNNFDPPPLVITGRPDWGPNLALEKHDRAIFVGFVPRDDLAALYAKALAVICTSELEGFGLPVLEGMAFGTPVIAFARGAVAEIVGSAGLLVDHGNAEAIGDAMRRMVVDKSLRSELGQLGLARVHDFSWKECAERTVEVYERAFASHRAQ